MKKCLSALFMNFRYEKSKFKVVSAACYHLIMPNKNWVDPTNDRFPQDFDFPKSKKICWTWHHWRPPLEKVRLPVLSFPHNIQ